MARRTQNRKHSSHKKSRKHQSYKLKQRKYKGGFKDVEDVAYSRQGGYMPFEGPAILAMEDIQRGGARDEAANCITTGQPNNRNNLPYYPYIARGSLNSGFQQGELSSPC